MCGPNGAGKSSLLAALGGLLDVDCGQVLLDGAALPRGAARAAALGYLPQGGGVAWDITVASLVALGRLPFGDERGAGAAMVARALAVMELEGLAQRPVSTLSGGERARALLARVLAGAPRWILADEPLANLDLGHGRRLMRALRAEALAGGGVVVVLHDLAAAMNHADRVLVLAGGRIVTDGPPQVALAPQILAQVWGVEACWLGEVGAFGLAMAG